MSERVIGCQLGAGRGGGGGREKKIASSYRFGKDREQFYVSLVKKQTSQLLTVTAVCNKREATRVNGEDAIL